MGRRPSTRRSSTRWPSTRRSPRHAAGRHGLEGLHLLGCEQVVHVQQGAQVVTQHRRLGSTKGVDLIHDRLALRPLGLQQRGEVGAGLLDRRLQILPLSAGALGDALDLLHSDGLDAQGGGVIPHEIVGLRRPFTATRPGRWSGPGAGGEVQQGETDEHAWDHTHDHSSWSVGCRNRVSRAP